jgi:uncharacterized membrane protein YcaP (DUF421 family)
MDVQWSELFSSTIPAAELFVRGSAMYWFLFLIFRVLLRRNVGSIAIADVLLLVLVADAAQNAMAGEYKSITDGFVLVGTIIGWNFLLDWLSYRSAALRRLLEPPKVVLVRDGQFQRRNLRKEFLAEEEVMAQLREKGVERVEEVKVAYMESDGSVSVIKKKK